MSNPGPFTLDVLGTLFLITHCGLRARVGHIASSARMTNYSAHSGGGGAVSIGGRSEVPARLTSLVADGATSECDPAALDATSDPAVSEAATADPRPRLARATSESARSDCRAGSARRLTRWLDGEAAASCAARRALRSL